MGLRTPLVALSCSRRYRSFDGRGHLDRDPCRSGGKGAQHGSGDGLEHHVGLADEAVAERSDVDARPPVSRGGAGSLNVGSAPTRHERLDGELRLDEHPGMVAKDRSKRVDKVLKEMRTSVDGRADAVLARPGARSP